MYFNDRVALGETLADRLKEFRGKDAILLCLNEESLLTCLSMAIHLKAWVYPLIYEPVYDPAVGMQLMGAVDQTGTFVPHPALGKDEAILATATEIAMQQKDAAIASIKKRVATYDMVFDANRLQGRVVILACDVLTDTLPLVVAERMLPRTSIKNLAIAIGNATPDVADLAQVSAGNVVLLDIISGITSSTESYFSQADSYNDAQKRTLTKHIATYWQ